MEKLLGIDVGSTTVKLTVSVCLFFFSWDSMPLEYCLAKLPEKEPKREAAKGDFALCGGRLKALP